MRIEVVGRPSEITEAVRNYVGLRLMSVLDHHVRQVSGVSVSLADTAIGSGDVGRRCRIRAQLIPRGSAIVEAMDAGLYGAIDGAAEELARAVARAGRSGFA